jgi:hypothetical protein
MKERKLWAKQLNEDTLMLEPLLSNPEPHLALRSSQP